MVGGSTCNNNNNGPNDVEDTSLTSELFLDKTTIVYGQSGTGKSTIIVEILYQLNQNIDQIIVISPTDPSNHTYSSGVVPKPLIHYNLTEKLLKKIWDRQEIFAAIYSRANQQTVLERLFRRLNLDHVTNILDNAHKCKAQALAKIEDSYIDKSIRNKKTEEIESKYSEFFNLVYKRYISENRSVLEKMRLTPDEKFTLKYLNFNPRMVIIFDDCSADFAGIKSTEGKQILGKMFYQNRWAFLTVIIAIHDYKLINSEWRKNAYNSIFTDSKGFRSYMNRETNGFSRDEANEILKKAPNVFSNGYQKLIYVRKHDKFYKFEATPRYDFQFGAPSIKKYCKMIEDDGLTIDQNNEFFGYFREDMQL